MTKIHRQKKPAAPFVVSAAAAHAAKLEKAGTDTVVGFHVQKLLDETNGRGSQGAGR
jgi:hypothetical protein